MAKSTKHSELARRVADDFDRLAFNFAALLRSEFEEPIAQSVISRVRFAVLDAVTAAQNATAIANGLQSEMFGQVRRRRAKTNEGENR